MLSKRRDDTARRHRDERRVDATTHHTLLARSGVSGASGTTPPPSSAPFLGLFEQPARAARVTAESSCAAGASAHASRAARKRSRACQRSAASSVIRSNRRSACADPRAGEAAGAVVREKRAARAREAGGKGGRVCAWRVCGLSTAIYAVVAGGGGVVHKTLRTHTRHQKQHRDDTATPPPPLPVSLSCSVAVGLNIDRSGVLIDCVARHHRRRHRRRATAKVPRERCNSCTCCSFIARLRSDAEPEVEPTQVRAERGCLPAAAAARAVVAVAAPRRRTLPDVVARGVSLFAQRAARDAPERERAAAVEPGRRLKRRDVNDDDARKAQRVRVWQRGHCDGMSAREPHSIFNPISKIPSRVYMRMRGGAVGVGDS